MKLNELMNVIDKWNVIDVCTTSPSRPYWSLYNGVVGGLTDVPDADVISRSMTTTTASASMSG